MDLGEKRGEVKARAANRQWFNLSIGVKLVVGFLAVGVLPLVVAGWLSYREMSTVLTETSTRRFEDVAVSVAADVDRRLLQMQADVEQKRAQFASHREQSDGSAALDQKWVDSVMSESEVFDLVAVVSVDGRVETVNSIDTQGSRLESDLTSADRLVKDEQWFVDALEAAPTNRVVVGDARSDLLSSSLYSETRTGLPFATAIYEQGEVSSILYLVGSFERVVGTTVDAAADRLLAEGLGTVGLRVVRTDGELLHASNPEVLFEPAAPGEPGTSGSMVGPGPNGVDLVCGFAVLAEGLSDDSGQPGSGGGYGWGIVIHQDTAEAFAALGEQRRSMLLVGLVTGVIIVVVATILTRALAAPLKETASKLNEVAGGDLRTRFMVRSPDEVGQMATALNQALEAIGSTLGHADRVSGEVSASASTMAQSSQRLRAGAEESASQTAAMIDSARSVTESSQAVADSMSSMSEGVKAISDSTVQAAKVTAEVVDVTASTRERMRMLESSAADIGDVVNVITAIAEQTNLLALNATIEAARVGEAGKGFAVVANEVKELAGQTSSATDEIQSKVEAIQTEAVRAVEAIAQISGLIEEVNATSAQIAVAVEEQSATAVQVEDSVGEVSSGITGFSTKIELVADEAERFRSGSSEVETAARQLAQTAVDLAQALGAFRLPGATGSDRKKAESTGGQRDRPRLKQLASVAPPKISAPERKASVPAPSGRVSTSSGRVSTSSGRVPAPSGRVSVDSHPPKVASTSGRAANPKPKGKEPSGPKSSKSDYTPRKKTGSGRSETGDEPMRLEDLARHLEQNGWE